MHAGDDLMIQVDGALHPCQVVDLENTYNPELCVSVWVFESTLFDREGLVALDIIC